MPTVLLGLVIVFAVLAGLVHVLIFVLESVLWSRPTVWSRFGFARQEDADVVRPMALNQGFYNLFLAVGVAIGLVLAAAGASAAGYGIALFSVASMLAAALVLVVSDPRLRRAAAVQGAMPLLAVGFLATGLAAG